MQSQPVVVLPGQLNLPEILLFCWSVCSMHDMIAAAVSSRTVAMVISLKYSSESQPAS
jgi:hypothetical protein